ncbi:sulfotransferase family protein [Owenweeksia hongkongensis]|uniref:sulfotransferase family protein n=1 Tax=Owenweeksia hongkongensis TaxID=253245 RepID=UPI003A8D5D96
MQDYTKPFFIIGNPRSGTSLFRLMLSNHPGMIVPPESGFMQWWHPTYHNWTAEDTANEAYLNQFIKDLSSSKKIETWKIDFDSLKLRIQKVIPKNYAQLIAQVYLQYTADNGNKNIERWGDKNNYFIEHLDLLHEIYPQAQFLFIVRDGRDVACSYKAIKNLKTESAYKPKLPYDIKDIANEWVENHQTILKFSRALEPSQCHFLKYEDLVFNPKAVLKEVTDFLKMEFSIEMLNYPDTNRSNKTEPLEMMDWKKKTLSEPDSSELGKYKKILSTREIQEFNKIAKPILNHFGYE